MIHSFSMVYRKISAPVGKPEKGYSHIPVSLQWLQMAAGRREKRTPGTLFFRKQKNFFNKLISGELKNHTFAAAEIKTAW
jgi:hypothetical protein